MKGNEIIVSANPKGVFEECIVVGTPYPGVVMEMKKATALVAGRFSYEPYGTTAANGASEGVAADGNRAPIAILLPDVHQGGLYNTAYVTGSRGFIYYPVMGEEFNMWLQNQSGTADDFIIGSKLIVDDGTGQLLISASTPESEPFVCLEAVTDMTSDTCTWVKFTGY